MVIITSDVDFGDCLHRLPSVLVIYSRDNKAFLDKFRHRIAWSEVLSEINLEIIAEVGLTRNDEIHLTEIIIRFRVAKLHISTLINFRIFLAPKLQLISKPIQFSLLNLETEFRRTKTLIDSLECETLALGCCNLSRLTLSRADPQDESERLQGWTCHHIQTFTNSNLIKFLSSEPRVMCPSLRAAKSVSVSVGLAISETEISIAVLRVIPNAQKILQEIRRFLNPFACVQAVWWITSSEHAALLKVEKGNEIKALERARGIKIEVLFPGLAVFTKKTANQSRQKVVVKERMVRGNAVEWKCSAMGSTETRVVKVEQIDFGTFPLEKYDENGVAKRPVMVIGFEFAEDAGLEFDDISSHYERASQQRFSKTRNFLSKADNAGNCAPMAIQIESFSVSLARNDFSSLVKKDEVKILFSLEPTESEDDDQLTLDRYAGFVSLIKYRFRVFQNHISEHFACQVEEVRGVGGEINTSVASNEHDESDNVPSVEDPDEYFDYFYSYLPVRKGLQAAIANQRSEIIEASGSKLREFRFHNEKAQKLRKGFVPVTFDTDSKLSATKALREMYAIYNRFIQSDSSSHNSTSSSSATFDLEVMMRDDWVDCCYVLVPPLSPTQQDSLHQQLNEISRRCQVDSLRLRTDLKQHFDRSVPLTLGCTRRDKAQQVAKMVSDALSNQTDNRLRALQIQGSVTETAKAVAYLHNFRSTLEIEKLKGQSSSPDQLRLIKSVVQATTLSTDNDDDGSGSLNESRCPNFNDADGQRQREDDVDALEGNEDELFVTLVKGRRNFEIMMVCAPTCKASLTALKNRLLPLVRECPEARLPLDSMLQLHLIDHTIVTRGGYEQFNKANNIFRLIFPPTRLFELKSLRSIPLLLSSASNVTCRYGAWFPSNVVPMLIQKVDRRSSEIKSSSSRLTPSDKQLLFVNVPGAKGNSILTIFEKRTNSTESLLACIGMSFSGILEY